MKTASYKIALGAMGTLCIVLAASMVDNQLVLDVETDQSLAGCPS